MDTRRVLLTEENYLIDEDFGYGYYRIKLNGRYAILYKDKIISEWYKYIGKFREGLAIVKDSKGLCGFIDKSGEEAIPCRYAQVWNFENGSACVQEVGTELTHRIDKNGKVVERTGGYPIGEEKVDRRKRVANESLKTRKKTIRLTESDLHRIVKNSVKRILRESEEQINTPDIRIYSTGPSVYVDVNNDDGKHSDGAYLAIVSEYGEDSSNTGCHVTYYPWLKSHPKAYKDIIEKLKAIEMDKTYCLGPRSTIEWMEMEEKGITWENGHYYKNGKKLN